jgi:sugar O-acyltransferase (sialic acid O-acetyltransferase NeuD family)
MTPVLILGAGGTAVDMLDCLQAINAISPRYTCLGLLDDNPELHGKDVHGTPILGPLAAVQEYAEALVISALGSPGTFWKRPEILTRLQLPRERFLTLVHPTASVSAWSTIGAGVFIYPHCTLTADCCLADHVTVLANSVVNHDTTIGEASILATGVLLSGRVQVGRCCYLGTGAMVRQEITIGDNSLIGVGSVVVRDVEPNSVMVGNPARFLRHTIPA